MTPILLNHMAPFHTVPAQGKVEGTACVLLADLEKRLLLLSSPPLLLPVQISHVLMLSQEKVIVSTLQGLMSRITSQHQSVCCKRLKLVLARQLAPLLPLMPSRPMLCSSVNHSQR